MSDQTIRGRIRRRWVDACSETGDVACMDCIEGQCSGSSHPVKVQITECDCGGHDVFGELQHNDGCPQFGGSERSA